MQDWERFGEEIRRTVQDAVDSEAEPDDHRYDQPGSERCGKWRGTGHAFFWKCV